jgi:aspartyl-tRNA(Asn)/glutamyl-tRNA(Gln) amidotransferase subunit B
MPGMLPVINEECVRQAVRTGLGLKAQINKRSVFDRKNYFYPDLPQGYQISASSSTRSSARARLRLDCRWRDAVECRHRAPASRAGRGQVDARPAPEHELRRPQPLGCRADGNRLQPDLRSSDEAKAYLSKLRTILRYLGTCDGNMEQGSMRADVNVSVRRPGAPSARAARSRTSTRSALSGAGHRIRGPPPDRYLEDGGTIDQETRLYDPRKGETRSMRSKEEAHDYRYFPDPDLLPLEFDDAFIAELAEGHLPELPDAKKDRFISRLRRHRL